VSNRFGLTELVMVGDRGMITNARIAELRRSPAPGFFMGVAGEGPELQPCYFDHGLPVRG
jgi:hypothetical protein